MEKKYKEQINYENISTIPWYKIYFILKKESSIDKEMFLHNLADKWLANSKMSDEKILKNIKRIIRKTRIKLNDIELSQLLILEERVFSIDRHIKIIDVNTSLSKNEHVGAKFTNANLFKDKKTKQIGHGDLFISNRRIMLISSDEQFSFLFSKIQFYQYKEYGFSYTMINGEEYLLRIHDQVTLSNTISNIINKKVKHAIKKCKNN